MIKKIQLLAFVFFSAACCFADTNTWRNNIPPRLQWESNHGYCGEVSLICAGLYYGQYVSQYDVRAIACDGAPQNQSQLLLGTNDRHAASQMHLSSIKWDTDSEQNTDDYMAWIKQNVTKGYPVVIGIYCNEWLFDDDPDPDAGDSDYDHIVPVMGIDSSHPLTDPHYYMDDSVFFSDNGIWEESGMPVYNFKYYFQAFQASRRQANRKKGPPYSVPNNASNYGIAITGVMDLKGDTLPVRVDVNCNYENPPIEDKSNQRPPSMPLVLTITVSNLQPNVQYNLYRYNDMDSVPNSDFNTNAGSAYESWPFQITSGTTYVMSEKINSNEMAIYRAVKASAP